MTTKTTNKHLTLVDRELIEQGIYSGKSKKEIADSIGKHPSTISKEIKLHRTVVSKCPLALECANYKKCRHGRYCTTSCIDYIPFSCSRRDRSPGACNGCTNYNKCRFDKYRYNSKEAHREYRDSLVYTRIGINATKEEIEKLGLKIKPLIDNGLSPYTILESLPEIKLSEMTLYTYIENGVFQDAGVSIKNIDLKRKSSRKLSKKQKVKFKKREDRSYIKGRTYKDYECFIEQNPNTKVVQMDTVYNDVTNGPFMQTFKFLKYSFVIILFHFTKTAESMLKGVNLLEKILGEELFQREVEVLLADRGSEFTKANEIECRDDGTRRTRIYYCDPMASWQRGSLEVNHSDIRSICPKNTNLYALGLQGQEDANIISSHINSYAKEKILEGKTPFQYLTFMNPTMVNKLLEFGIAEVPIYNVILKPHLLKK